MIPTPCWNCSPHADRSGHPPKCNRKVQRRYDQYLYKLRHIMENTFLKFKAWRSIATRYAKTTASFLAECQLAAIILWLR